MHFTGIKIHWQKFTLFKVVLSCISGPILKSASVAEHSKVLYVVITESLKLEVRFEVPSNAKGSH